jgi:DNA repair protein RadC
MTALPLPASLELQPVVDPAAGMADTLGGAGFERLDGDPAVRTRTIARRYGVDVLHDVEILSLHLARTEVAEPWATAEALTTRFGGLSAILAADRAELLRYVHEEAVLDLKLARETAIRVALADLPGRCLLTSSGAVKAYLRSCMVGLPREEFWVLFLDRTNHLILSERQSQGTVDHVPVYPREVLRRALEVGASAMILAHNHPSGDPTPSRPDLDMTKAIVKGGAALSISVWDHMIVGRDQVLSLKGEGLM